LIKLGYGATAFIHFIVFSDGELSDGFRWCENYEKKIACEGSIANIECPYAMRIFIIDRFFGRKTSDV